MLFGGAGGFVDAEDGKDLAIGEREVGKVLKPARMNQP
jgi:hypothetical protein